MQPGKQIPPLDDMRRFIEDRLTPRGTMPDRARLGYNQVLELYSGLLVEEMIFREMMQVAILRNEIRSIKNAYN